MKHRSVDDVVIGYVNKGNLLALGGLMLVFAASVFWYFSGKQHGDLLQVQTDQTQREVYLWIHHFQGLPQVIGKYHEVSDLLMHPTQEKQESLNYFLLQLTDTIGVNFAYIFDRNGKVLAASNFYNDLNFIDDDYSFRPYVLSAMRGDNGNYMAIGMKTKQRGFYFSAPVRENGEIIGGIALKVNIDFLTTLKAADNTDLLFLDEKNIVFHSTSGRFERKALVRLSEQDQQALIAEKRFDGQRVQSIGNGSVLPPGMSEGMQLRVGNHYGYYTGYKLPIPGMSWSVMSVSGYEYRIKLVAEWCGIFLLIYTALSAFLLVYKGRRRHHRDIAALNSSLEHRVQQLASNLTTKNEELEQSLAHYKHTQKELEATQSELIQTAKLAVLGEMAAGLNHELNQPLQALIAYSQNGKKFIARNNIALAEKNLEEIALIATNMAETVAKFKVFSRKAMPDSRNCRIEEILNNVSAIVTPQLLQNHIEYHIQLESHDMMVNCEPVMIGQVLVNLVSNASHALADTENGKITVYVAERGESVSIDVIDNGSGMNEEVLNNIFEPFFTTKEKGLGLGLTISRRIVEAQNGTLSARNMQPHGTAFTIVLPK